MSGAGRAFSAGGDLEFLDDRAADSPENNVTAMMAFYCAPTARGVSWMVDGGGVVDGSEFWASDGCQRCPLTHGGSPPSVSPCAKSASPCADRFLSIRTLRVPTVAAINGHAVGAGLCFAMASDIRVAQRGARLGVNFVKVLPVIGF